MKNNAEIIKQIKSYCINKPCSYETRPFGEYPICYRIMGKIFAQLNPDSNFYRITLKCNPEQAYIYRQIYPQVVVRGWHCPPVQQPYWNTIDLDKFVDMDMLFQMIDEAYNEIVKKMTKKDRGRYFHLQQLEFCYTDGSNKDFAMLCDKLDEALDELVQGKFDRTQYSEFNIRDDIHNVIVVFKDGKPVGCGGYKVYDNERVELKRIYTVPSVRGMGLGAEIVRRLEAQAKINGFTWCILETGELLKAACHVYQRLGYKRIPNYGVYEDMEDSICMQRKI